MNTAEPPGTTAPSTPPCSTSQVPTGDFTTDRGNDGGRPDVAAASAERVAVAIAWTAGERRPASNEAPAELGEQRFG